MPQDDIPALLSDPDAVHLNLLRGTLARPSVAQIIHLYGAEALRAALPSPPEPDPRIVDLERLIAERTALFQGQLSEAENRAATAERRERALLDSNQRERSALTELVSLRSRLRDAGRRAAADPEQALDLLMSVVREAGSA